MSLTHFSINRFDHINACLYTTTIIVRCASHASNIVEFSGHASLPQLEHDPLTVQMQRTLYHSTYTTHPSPTTPQLLVIFIYALQTSLGPSLPPQVQATYSFISWL